MHVDLIEDLCILCIGTFMHLMGVSLFALNFPTSMRLVPNIPSTLLVITLLVTMTEWRPIRGDSGTRRSHSQRILRLLMELIIIVCVVELLLVWIWVPMLSELCTLCEWAIEGHIEEQFPNLANWLDSYLFYLLRFLLAMCLCSVIALCQCWFIRRKPKVGLDVGRHKNARPPCNNGHMPEHVPINERPNIERCNRDRFRRPHNIRSATTSHSVA